MEPHLGNNDIDMFYKYLDKATNYFEYGSGGSTYQANKRDNIEKIYSVESDEDWHNKLKDQVIGNKITYIYNEMDVLPNTWGHPGPNVTEEQKRNYSSHILKLSEEEQKKIDLVFIDGRFRVACCLKCFSVINDDCLIAFDDFIDRPFYHAPVLEFFQIVEKTKDNRMVILKKKPYVSYVPDEVIKAVELRNM